MAAASKRKNRSSPLSFTDEEWELVTAACPPDTELAVFLREAALSAIRSGSTAGEGLSRIEQLIRRATAMILAAGSDTLEFDDALATVNNFADDGGMASPPTPQEVSANGRFHQ